MDKVQLEVAQRGVALERALQGLVTALEMPVGRDKFGAERTSARLDAVDKALFEANKLLHPRRYEK